MNIEALRKRLADAELVEAARAARDRDWRDARVADRVEADEIVARRVTELEEGLLVTIASDADADTSFSARQGARRFLHAGHSAIGASDEKLHSLARLHFEVVRLLIDNTSSPIAERLDALERVAWTALHTQAVHVADPGRA